MKTRVVNVTEGKILSGIIRFSVPIILSNLLQISFNAADVAVVGTFCGSNSVAAIGATSSLIHLLLNLFIGLATGTTIAVSYAVSEKRDTDAQEHSHNAMATALISGFFIAIVGIFVSKPFLSLLGTPNGEILDKATIYMRIYLSGTPALLIYNFGSAISKANGDSRRPFIFLSIGGVANVILNLIFVLAFDMSVEGVAIATVISNVISAYLMLRYLIKLDSPSKIKLKEIKIHKKKLSEILKYGLPAGIQSCMFSIPNLMIQSAVNSFGPASIAGNTAATNIGGYYDVTNSAFSETTLTFVARNFGAKKEKRVNEASITLLIISALFAAVVGIGSYVFATPLLSIFIPGNTEAINYGTIRMFFVGVPNFFGAIMVVLTAIIRGLGKPLFPMISTIFCVCVIRIIWLLTVYPLYPTIECVYFTYPLTWFLTVLVLSVYLIINYKKLAKNSI